MNKVHYEIVSYALLCMIVWCVAVKLAKVYHKNIVYPVGLHMYCKLIHGPYISRL